MGDATSQGDRDLGVVSATSWLDELGVTGCGLVTMIRGALL